MSDNATSSAQGTTHAQPEMPGRLRETPVSWLLCFTIVLVIMNTMMFNLALPKISLQFELSPSTASWIVTGYSIIFAIASITYSRLSDFVPIRRLYVIALLSLGGASILGLFTDSFGLLLLTRLIQASGAGAIPSLGIVFVTRYIPLSRRGRAMSLILSAASLGLGLGPVAGGSIVQYLGWHFLFVITGVTLLLIPIFLILLPKEKPASGSFDFIGALLLGIGTTGLLLFLTSKSLVALLVGILAIALFALRIRRVSQPFVLPALFGDRPYMSLGAIGVFSYMISFGFLFLAPQMLARVFGLAPLTSGLLLFPGALLAMLVSNRVGRIIDRYGNTALLRYVPWLMLVSTVGLALTASYSYYWIAALYILVSISFTTLSSAVSNELSRQLTTDRIGSGMGLFQLLQFFSGAFAVALSGSALVWQKSLPLERAFDNLIWGMAVVALLTIGSSILYRSYAKKRHMGVVTTESVGSPVVAATATE
ncbi:Putative multidrug resistance protein MdtD [Paenibacillus allorhizoplanae]|uniref:Multidrug resistance protein MdtD n=1 Tax=Paenibacillus allorhizoplanae TaxID=2905648 RepID=A0ABM9CHZ5_9BACL|nr:MFS transporter [Paenibacillus allorhizoplanae]CAH1213393.1 Putative multidrug resistance protein MdtD [Paenibacillus allorhizoplanae]